MRIVVLTSAFLLALVQARAIQPWSDGYNISNVAVTAGDDSRPLYLPYPPATDDLYNKCKCKGENFRKAIHSSSADAGKLFNPSRDSSESTHTDICKHSDILYAQKETDIER